jgi:hypothetical protein
LIEYGLAHLDELRTTFAARPQDGHPTHDSG